MYCVTTPGPSVMIHHISPHTHPSLHHPHSSHRSPSLLTPALLSCPLTGSPSSRLPCLTSLSPSTLSRCLWRQSLPTSVPPTVAAASWTSLRGRWPRLLTECRKPTKSWSPRVSSSSSSRHVTHNVLTNQLLACLETCMSLVAKWFRLSFTFSVCVLYQMNGLI